MSKRHIKNLEIGTAAIPVLDGLSIPMRGKVLTALYCETIGTEPEFNISKNLLGRVTAIQIITSLSDERVEISTAAIPVLEGLSIPMRGKVLTVLYCNATGTEPDFNQSKNLTNIVAEIQIITRRAKELDEKELPAKTERQEYMRRVRSKAGKEGGRGNKKDTREAVESKKSKMELLKANESKKKQKSQTPRKPAKSDPLDGQMPVGVSLIKSDKIDKDLIDKNINDSHTNQSNHQSITMEWLHEIATEIKIELSAAGFSQVLASITARIDAADKPPIGNITNYAKTTLRNAQKSEARAGYSKGGKSPPASNPHLNRFANFNQREIDFDKYEELERELLNQKLPPTGSAAV